MKKIVGLSLVIFATLSLAACGDSGKTTEKKGTATQKTEETTSAKESDTAASSSVDEKGEALEELPDGVDARNTFTVDWSEDWHDVNFKITDISVVQYSDEEIINAMDADFMIGVKFVIINNSDHKITTYPDQGKVVINGKQADSNMFVSDDVGGEIMNGSSVEGVVVYPLKDITSVDDVKEVRVVWNATDFDSGNMDDTGKDFDVPLQLNN